MRQPPKMNVFVVLSIACLTRIAAKQQSEFVTVQDLNSDHDRRNLDAGLPRYLEFNLLRDGAKVNLKLEENVHLSKYPPVYDAEKRADGKFRWIQKDMPHLQTERFYQDLTNGGGFVVQCELHVSGPCRRVLTGNLFINGRNFDIVPATDIEYKRELFLGDGTPHLLIENDFQEMVKRQFLSDYSEDKRQLFDYNNSAIKRQLVDLGYAEDQRQPFDPVSDYAKDKRQPFDLVINKVARKRLTHDEGKLHETLRELFENRQDHRYKREAKKTKYTVELQVLVDPALYNKIYQRTAATETRNREAETKYQLRKYICLVTNLVSLRYRMIKDDDAEFDVKLSGITIHTTMTDAWNLPIKRVVGQRGVYADADKFIADTHQWMPKQDMPSTDHLLVLTGINIYGTDWKTGKQLDGVMGISFKREICDARKKTSIVEDSSGYFATAILVAHELGHNLGAEHDGDLTEKACPPKSNYIMETFIPAADDKASYIVNPYRFSTCSVRAFKRKIRQLDDADDNCLLNEGQVYNATEWTANTAKLPGELYDLDAQCKLIYGSFSESCGIYGDFTLDKVCSALQCKTESGYCFKWLHRAATGTKCGDNKWCSEGYCVKTDAPAPEPGKCKDIGVGELTCGSLFESHSKQGKYQGLDEFCYHYEDVCCQYCSNKYVLYRLVDTKGEWTGSGSGRLEVLYNGSWGNVCDDNFWEGEAMVACQSMGFDEGEKAANERYEHGYGPRKFWMDDVKCIYFERALGYCDFPGWGVISKNCDESKIVTLKCKQKASDVCENMGYEDPKTHQTYSCGQMMFQTVFTTQKTPLELCKTHPKNFPKHCCKLCKEYGYEAPQNMITAPLPPPTTTTTTTSTSTTTTTPSPTTMTTTQPPPPPTTTTTTPPPPPPTTTTTTPSPPPPTTTTTTPPPLPPTTTTTTPPPPPPTTTTTTPPPPPPTTTTTTPPPPPPTTTTTTPPPPPPTTTTATPPPPPPTTTTTTSPPPPPTTTTTTPPSTTTEWIITTDSSQQ